MKKVLGVRRDIWIIMVVLSIVGGLGYAAYRVHSTMRRAFRSLQVEILTHDLLEHYIREHGRWPTSWVDLRNTPLPGRPDWPAEWQDAEQYVSIDFSLTLPEVLQQDPEQFTAVRPIGPHYQNFEKSFAQHLAQFRSLPNRGPAREPAAR